MSQPNPLLSCPHCSYLPRSPHSKPSCAPRTSGSPPPLPTSPSLVASPPAPCPETQAAQPGCAPQSPLLFITLSGSPSVPGALELRRSFPKLSATRSPIPPALLTWLRHCSHKEMGSTFLPLESGCAYDCGLWLHPLEKEMATHSSILAWKVSWTEEPGRLQSMGSQRVEDNWMTNTHTFPIYTYKSLFPTY